MGIRNKKRETLRRLDSKTLDAKFLQEIQHGLNCSPFESEAVLEVVKEVYFPFFDEQSIKAPPGKVTLIAVSADEPAGKPVVDCEKQNVCLAIHRGLEAVDRYLGQFDRVRHCQLQGLSAIETAHILNCGVTLVKAYLQIDREQEGKDA